MPATSRRWGEPKSKQSPIGFYVLDVPIYIYKLVICYYTRYISIYLYYWDVPNELNPKCLVSAGCVLAFGGALDRSTITVGMIGTNNYPNVMSLSRAHV